MINLNPEIEKDVNLLIFFENSLFQENEIRKKIEEINKKKQQELGKSYNSVVNEQNSKIKKRKLVEDVFPPNQNEQLKTAQIVPKHNNRKTACEKFRHCITNVMPFIKFNDQKKNIFKQASEVSGQKSSDYKYSLRAIEIHYYNCKKQDLNEKNCSQFYHDKIEEEKEERRKKLISLNIGFELKNF